MKAITQLVALAILLLALPAAAQTTYDWSAVGSTGAVTPGQSGYIFTGPTFTFASLRTGNQFARYQVTNTYGSGASKTPGWTTLWASYTDDSNTGSVTVRLIEVDKCSNTETQICSITSSDGTSDPQCSSCTFNSSTIDFANNTYYIEVKLNRALRSTATEALHSVGLN